MTITFFIFIASSCVVVTALLFALVQWAHIRAAWIGSHKTAATLFCICFLLYAVGQTIVILEALGFLPYSNLSSYMYATAALLFAVGSWYMHKGVKK